VKIADEDKREALFEIEKMKEEVSAYKSEIQTMKEALGEKERRLREVEVREQDLQQENEHLKDQSSLSQTELSNLQEQIAHSKKRAASFADKYSKMKSKLNEAIEEQQDLYRRSLESYRKEKAAFEELSDENDKRNAALQSLRDTLEESRLKQRDIVIGIGEIRAEFDRDNKLSKCTHRSSVWCGLLMFKKEAGQIYKLESELAETKANLANEQALSTEMCARFESQDTIKGLIEPLEHKLTQLSDLCTGVVPKQDEMKQSREALES
jgi:chromosome segregation ATPase